MLRRAALRQFSSLSRSQFRFSKLPQDVSNGAPVQFYKVHFKRPSIVTWRRARQGLLYTMTLVAVWRYIVPEFVTISFVEVEEETMGEDGEPDVQTEEGDEEEIEDGFFIPFGWPKQQARRFYKASDPEWKEFVKFSKQTKRHKEIQLRLVSMIRNEVAALPSTKHILGDIDVGKGRYWLEIIFPDGPPRDYEVSGIEITDEFIAWAIKRIDQKEYQRLKRTMFPTAALHASMASFRYHLDTQTNKIREYLGLEPKVNPEVALIRASLREKPDTNSFGKGPSSPNTALDAPPKAPTGRFTPIAEGAKRQVENPEADNGAGFPKLPSIVPQGESKPVTLALFLHNLKKNRKPFAIEPPRGSVVVTGLVDVIGTKGRTTLDVTAAYDPPTDEFVLKGWTPRRTQPKSQRPRGGP